MTPRVWTAHLVFIKRHPLLFCPENSSIFSFNSLSITSSTSPNTHQSIHSITPVPMSIMYRRNQPLGLLSSLGPYGLHNRGGSMLNRQHLFGGLGYCSGSTCENDAVTGQHTCMCYLASQYLQLGQYLIGECDCPTCPLLQSLSYGGGLLASGYGR